MMCCHSGVSKMTRNQMIKAIGAAALGWLMLGPAQAADPLNGASLYGAKCATCHGANGRPVMPGTPDFSRGERLLRSDIDLLKSIRAGMGVMPAYQGLLSDDEILDIVAHLRTLR